MLNNKRTQIRGSLRREEIENLFMLKRKELLQGKISIFRQLDQAITAEHSNRNDIELVGAILTCLHNYPQEENTFILIGNYLFENNQNITYFFNPVVDSPKYLENQMWCFKLISRILEQQAKIKPQQQHSIIEQMQQLVDSACEIVGQLLVTLQTNRNSHDKQLKIWFYFMQIIKVQLTSHLYSDFPHKSIAYFNQTLSLIPISSDQTSEINHLWWCLKIIFNNLEQIKVRSKLIEQSSSIFCLVLKQFPQQREQCLQIMTFILKNYAIDFMHLIFNQQTIAQVLYIFDQLPIFKNKIANFLKLIIPTCSLEQTVTLLKKGTHKMLTQAMEWSMNNCNNECLEDCLGSAYFLLLKIKDGGQQKLLDRVLQQMQGLHFDKMLQGMISQPQNKTVSEYLNLLIDDFYSQEAI